MSATFDFTSDNQVSGIRFAVDNVGQLYAILKHFEGKDKIVDMILNNHIKISDNIEQEQKQFDKPEEHKEKINKRKREETEDDDHESDCSGDFDNLSEIVRVKGKSSDDSEHRVKVYKCGSGQKKSVGRPRIYNKVIEPFENEKYEKYINKSVVYAALLKYQRGEVIKLASTSNIDTVGHDLFQIYRKSGMGNLLEILPICVGYSANMAGPKLRGLFCTELEDNNRKIKFDNHEMIFDSSKACKKDIIELFSQINQFD
jgi:hypothetical protein